MSPTPQPVVNSNGNGNNNSNNTPLPPVKIEEELLKKRREEEREKFEKERREYQERLARQDQWASTSRRELPTKEIKMGKHNKGSYAVPQEVPRNNPKYTTDKPKKHKHASPPSSRSSASSEEQYYKKFAKRPNRFKELYGGGSDSDEEDSFESSYHLHIRRSMERIGIDTVIGTAIDTVIGTAIDTAIDTVIGTGVGIMIDMPDIMRSKVIPGRNIMTLIPSMKSLDMIIEPGKSLKNIEIKIGNNTKIHTGNNTDTKEDPK